MKPNTICSIGIDVGSTTLKVVVLNDRNEIIYKVYRRHKADFNTLFVEELNTVTSRFPDCRFTMAWGYPNGQGFLLFRKSLHL